MEPNSQSKTVKHHLLLLTLLWFFLLIILPWKGFFLLNDDYVYEWNVRHFSERGLNLHTYTTPTLIFQVILGVLVYAVSPDPSYLRLLTSVFYLVGAIYMYKLLVLEKIHNKKAFLLTLLMFFNPLYLHLGFTFMSETYFLTTILICVYYYAKGAQESEQKLNSFLSVLFWTFAFLSRQVALFFLPAFILTDFFILKKRNPKSYAKYLIPISVFLAYELFFPKTLVYTQGSIIKSLESLGLFSTYITAIERLFKTLFYFGLFTFPITLPFLFQKLIEKQFFTKKMLIPFLVTSAILAVVAVYFWKTQTQLMFYIPNILTYAGFLPASLHMGIKQTLFVNSPVRARAFITLLSLVSFAGLSVMASSNLKTLLKEKSTFWVLSLATAISMGTFFVFRSYYDRYILVALPLLLLALGKWMNFKKPALILSYALVGVLAATSVAMEHDYLSLIKTVWEIPEKYGIEKLEYYSTFEFNAYHRLEHFADAQTMEEISQKAWMPPREDYEAFASYTKVKGFYVEETVNYKSLISPEFEGGLLLMRKVPEGMGELQD